MTTTALAGWFGSNRMLAKTVGQQLGRLEWCGVPFCGGCCELPYIQARTGNAADLHRHVINLARVVRDPALRGQLAARLDATLFHPDELAAAQRACRRVEAEFDGGVKLFGETLKVTNEPIVDWAYDYALCCWMGRGGQAGTPGEFTQGISVRWDAGGGDSCRRFRSWTESLDAWGAALLPWNFVVMDCFDFLDKVKDRAGHGVYADAPWPGPGDGYTYKFDEHKQRALAEKLAGFKAAKVVIRYGDHPLIRELYPRGRWNWVEQTSRSQANGDVAEVLIVNGGAA